MYQSKQIAFYLDFKSELNMSYNPPPPAYPVQQQQGATVVVTAQPTALIQHFMETPVRTTCPSCRADIVTSTHFETGTITWIACIVIASLGCWLGCCLIPFCIDPCKDVVHTCPRCRHLIGRHNRA